MRDIRYLACRHFDQDYAIPTSGRRSQVAGRKLMLRLRLATCDMFMSIWYDASDQDASLPQFVTSSWAETSVTPRDLICPYP